MTTVWVARYKDPGFSLSPEVVRVFATYEAAKAAFPSDSRWLPETYRRSDDASAWLCPELAALICPYEVES